MTLLWFVVWLVANAIGDREPLAADPVNIWTGALILAIALDLGRNQAAAIARPRSRAPRERSEKRQPA